jgi:hypothetical protein
MYHYTVRCEFNLANEKLIGRWVDWLVESHIQDVLDGGASRAVFLKMNSEVPTFEIRYEFESQDSFENYEVHHAPRLRQHGIEKFPPDDLGMKYSRTEGQVLNSFLAS